MTPLHERDSRDYAGLKKRIHAIAQDYFQLRLRISTLAYNHEHKHDECNAVIIILSNVDFPNPSCPRKTQTLIYCTKH